MSDSIGVIGYCYEDRRTKRTGVLMERDEDKKVLLFLDEATGAPFTVTFASFRSNWRKVKVEEVVPEEESAEEAPSEAKSGPVSAMTEDEKVVDFINSLSETRSIRFTKSPKESNNTDLYVDEVRAMTMEKNVGGIRVTMLPDLYTYSPIKNHVIPGSLYFNAEGHLSVSFVCDYTEFGDILQAIKQAAIELNLYGYTVEE